MLAQLRRVTSMLYRMPSMDFVVEYRFFWPEANMVFRFLTPFAETLLW